MITIRNIDAEPKYIVWKGEQLILKGFAEEAFPDEIAKKFIAENRQFVEEVVLDMVGGVYEPEEIQHTQWVANMTGNPDDPDEVIRTKRNKKTDIVETYRIRNPKKDPRVIAREMKGVTKEYRTKNGLGATASLPGKTVMIPPYKRREMLAAEASWFVNRSNNAPYPDERGAVILSRPPSTFEPDKTWPLDQLRAYLKLCDHKADLGMSEAELREKFTDKGTFDKKGYEKAVHEAKAACLKRLHFRLADPRYRLPTKVEFEEYMQRGFNRAAVDAEKASKLVDGALKGARQ